MHLHADCAENDFDDFLRRASMHNIEVIRTLLPPSCHRYVDDELLYSVL